MSFSIFLSHLATQGTFVSHVADELESRGLRAFVSGRDIPESVEWLDKIEAALRGADALAAFLEKGFRDSAWTDQEVGYALGRGRVVLPLRFDLETVPHGFLNRYQAVEIAGLAPAEVSDKILDALMRYPDSCSKLLPLVVERLHECRAVQHIAPWLHRLNIADVIPARITIELRTVARTNPTIRNTPTLFHQIEHHLSPSDRERQP